MRGLNINGKAIVPLRAVSIMSAGEIRPFAAVLAVGDRRPFDQRTFQTLIKAHYLDADETPRPMAAADFGAMLDTLDEMVRNGADVADQIGTLPRRIFVFRSDLDTVVTEINGLRRNGPGLPPVQLSDWPLCSEDDANLALEGFESLLPIPIPLPAIGVTARRKAEIDRVLKMVDGRAGKVGRQLNLSEMPGTRDEFLKLLKHESPELRALTDDAIRQDYFSSMGIEFRNGRRRKSEGPDPLYSLT